MEIEWEDRGKIPYDIHNISCSVSRFWCNLEQNQRNYWNYIFDACVSAEKKIIPDGKTILILKHGENNGQ